MSLFSQLKSLCCYSHNFCWPLQAFVAEAMLIMATIIHLGKSGLSEKVSTCHCQ